MSRNSITGHSSYFVTVQIFYYDCNFLQTKLFTSNSAKKKKKSIIRKISQTTSAITAHATLPIFTAQIYEAETWLQAAFKNRFRRWRLRRGGCCVVVKGYKAPFT